MTHDEISLSIEEIMGAEYGNVASLLSESQLDILAAEIKAGIDSDEQSREEWAKGIERWIELAAQVWEAKSTPWPNAANVKYPLLTIASMQFAARAYSALLPGTQWVNSKVIGKDPDGTKREAGIRVSTHMSYQLTDELEEWEEEHDRMLHVLPLVGTAFKKTYYDPEKGRNVSEYVPAKDLIVDYNAKNLAGAERKTHLVNFYDHELETMFRSGMFVRPSTELSKGSDVKRNTNADNTQGLNKPTAGSSLHDVGECHCYLDLDGDGLSEPYIVHIHLSSCKILRIARNYDEADILMSPVEGGKIMKVNPGTYFTSYIFIPDPNSGVYGLGFGHLLGPLNETLNTIINQLVDAGTMSNLGGGFITKNFALRGGNLKFKPQEWKVINSVGRDIREGIFPLPVREPSGVLFSLLGFLENSGMRLASAVDLLSGDIPGQNTKATVALAAIEQGLKVFTSIYKRLHKSFKRELRLMFILNSKYLTNEQYATILDSEEEVDVSADYDVESLNILPYSDPNVSSEQVRLAKAQAIFDVLPLGRINQEEATRRYLEATEQPEIDKLMDVGEPQPDPELVLKQVELQHKIEMDNRKQVLDAARADVQMLRERSVAILNLAKAEGVEKGIQLELYKDSMKQLADSENRLMDLYKQMLQQKQQQEQAPNQEQQ